MDLTVVGCSGSVPGPDGPASCYLVEHDGFRLVLDLGNGAFGSLMNLVDPGSVDAVVLTHLHDDHCVDLHALHLARRLGGYGNGGPIDVFGPGETAMSFRRIAQGLSLHDLRTTRHIGPFAVRTAAMAHPVETHAVRLEADAVSLVYTADTGPNDRIVALAQGADVLLAESSFRERDDNPVDLHLTGRQAGQIARAADVGQLVVTHVPPWHERSEAAAEAGAAFTGPTVSATVGLRVGAG